MRYIVFGIIVLIALYSCGKDEKPVQIDAIEELKVMRGDKVVYLQWSLDYNEIFGLEREVTADIFRAQSEQQFQKILRFHYDLLKYWSFADSTVSNSVKYFYFIRLEFSPCIPEDLIRYSVSETISVIPDSGVPAPIPNSPDSVKIVAENDSFVFSWILPEGCDSLYYLLMSSNGEYYYAFAYAWDPHPASFYPIKLELPQYSFINLKDNKVRYYKCIAFINNIMSIPSIPISVKHE